MRTKLFLFILLILSGGQLSAQRVNKARTFNLSAPASTGATYEAQQTITLEPGFSFEATTDQKWIGRINPYQVHDTTPLSVPGGIPIEIDPSRAVGTLPGSWAVNEQGAFTYAIPIPLPPGNNVAPNLSLYYNSQGGSGIMGLGWSFSELSSIHCDAKNFYNDTAVTRMSSDVFALDGNRLIWTGDYYRTEQETFRKIVPKGQLLFGQPEWFEVTTRDGLVMEYGRVASSRTGNPTNRVFAWMLGKITDQHGNYMEYVYRSESGFETLLDSIKYTGHTSGLAPYNVVKFLYGDRPDAGKSYVDGFQVAASKILTDIVVSHEGAVVSTTTLTYDSSWVYPRLTEVNFTGADGKSYNPHLIQWNSPASGTDQFRSYSLSGITDSSRYVTGDFNGDGITDIVAYKEKSGYGAGDSLHFYAGRAGSFFLKECAADLPDYFAGAGVAYGRHNSTRPALVTDVDGDGKDELFILKTIDNIYFYSIWTFNGTVFVDQQNPLVFNSSDIVEVAEVTGDTKADIIWYAPGGTYLKVLPGGGQIETFQTPVIDEVFIGQSLTGAPPEIKVRWLNAEGNTCTKRISYDMKTAQWQQENSPCGEWNAANFEHPFALDINGDGLLDELNSRSAPYHHFYLDWITKFDGFTLGNPVHDLYPDLEHFDILVPGDFNGDGRDDLLSIKNNGGASSTWSFHITKKFPLQASNSWFEKHTLQVADSIIGRRLDVGDFNGDGALEVLAHFAHAPWNRIIGYRPYQPGQINHIRDGIGNTVMVKTTPYTAIIKLPASSESVTYPIIKQTLPIKVTTEVATGQSEGNHVLQQYSYGDMIIDNWKYGFTGFLKKDVYTIFYENDRSILSAGYHSKKFGIAPFRYLVLTEENFFDRGDKKISYTYDYLSFGSKRHLAYTQKTVTIDNLSGVTTEATTTLDPLGNISRSEETVINSNSASVVTEYFDYSSQGSWMPARAQRIKVTTKHKDDPTAFTEETAYEYDSKGKTKKITGHVGKSQQKITDHFYNGFGTLDSSVASVTGESKSRRVAFTYDSKFRSVIGTKDSKGFTTSGSFDYRFGVPTSTTDENGLVSLMEYDGFGRVKSATDPLGIKTEYSYQWCKGETPTAVHKAIAKREGTAGTTSYFTGEGLLCRTETESYGDKKVLQDFVYFPDGQLRTSTQPYFAGDVPRLAVTNTYDDHGRLIKSQTPNTTVEQTYSGLTTTVENTTTGVKSIMGYNADGSAKEVTDNLNTPLVYAYKSHGGLATVQTPTKTITHHYDDLGRLDSILDPDLGLTTLQYNGFGEITKQTRPENKDYALTYDELGRILTKTGTEGTYSYEYDNMEHGKLLPSHITGPGGHEENFSYDEFSRLKSKTEVIAGASFTKAYEYNELGQLSAVIYPTGLKLQYDYDDKGYPQQIRMGQKTLWLCLETDRWGNVVKELRGNGKITTRSFDENGIPYETQTGGAENLIQHNEWKTDPASGNLEWRHNRKHGKKELFTYDGLHRLLTIAVEGDTGAADSITYEVDGRIKQKHDAGKYAYNDPTHPHAVTLVENPENIPSWRQDITYTPFDMAAGIYEKCYEDPDADSCWKLLFDYGYDHSRTRTRLMQGTALKETRIYSDNYEKITKDGTTKELVYIAGPTGIIAVAEKTPAGESLHYVYTDHLGSWEVITGESGAVEEEHSYDAWGRHRDPVTLEPLEGGALSGVEGRFSRGYTGHEHLDRFGLINMNGRIYDPVLGRMLSPDPMRQAPGYSQNYDAYAYAFNNPLKYTDPSGYVTTGYRGPYMGEGSSAGAQPPVYYVDGMPVSSSIARAVLGGGSGGGSGSGGGAAGSVAKMGFAGQENTLTYFDVERYTGGYDMISMDQVNALAAKHVTIWAGNPAEWGFEWWEDADGNIMMLNSFQTDEQQQELSTLEKVQFGLEAQNGGANSLNAEYPLSSTIGNVIGVATTFGQAAAQSTANELKNAKYAVRGQNLAKQAAQMTKIARGIGIVGGVAGTAISGYNIVSGSATTIDYFDFGVGATSVGAAIFLATNPVGWAIGAGATIYFAGRLAYDFYQETNK